MEKVAEDAGIPRQNSRTAEELAAIKTEEDAKIKAEIEKDHPEAPNLGEDSGDTPSDATFQPKPE